jgi:hypothetical protein
LSVHLGLGLFAREIGERRGQVRRYLALSPEVYMASDCVTKHGPTSSWHIKLSQTLHADRDRDENGGLFQGSHRVKHP